MGRYLPTHQVATQRRGRLGSPGKVSCPALLCLLRIETALEGQPSTVRSRRVWWRAQQTASVLSPGCTSVSCERLSTHAAHACVRGVLSMHATLHTERRANVRISKPIRSGREGAGR